MVALLHIVVSVLFACILRVYTIHDSADITAQCEQDTCGAVSLLQTGLKVRELHEIQADQHTVPYKTVGVPEYVEGVPPGGVERAIAEAVAANISHLDGPDETVAKLKLPDYSEDPERQDVWALYGLNRKKQPLRTDGMFEIAEMGGKCYLTVPLITDQYPRDDPMAKVHQFFAKDPQYSGFTFGECPSILPVQRKKRLRHLGRNPALAPLPPSLRIAFPEGRWIAMACIPMGTLQILDKDFDLIDATQVGMVGSELLPAKGYSIDFGTMEDTGENVTTAESLLSGDPRLMLLNDGTVVMSFMPYMLQSIFGFALPDTWWYHQVFAPLHIEIKESRLTAWIDRLEARYQYACPEIYPQNAFGGIGKNNGFLQPPDSDELYSVDWIYPAGVGLLDLKSPTISTKDYLDRFFFGATCFGYGYPESLKDEKSVFGVRPPEYLLDVEELKEKRREDPNYSKYNTPSGGSPPIWVDEMKSFVGIGHMKRGYADSVYNRAVLKHEAGRYGHHYTQVFYAMSRESPGGPFRTTHLSSEFCFESDVDSSDCESIQFAAGLVRDGDDFVISYGESDVRGHVVTLKVSAVIERLRPIM